jgi:hypothetical protein
MKPLKRIELVLSGDKSKLTGNYSKLSGDCSGLKGDCSRLSGNAVKNGTTVRVFQPGPFGGTEPTEGEITLEGPHYPKAHTWYARAVLKNGKIISVK